MLAPWLTAQLWQGGYHIWMSGVLTSNLKHSQCVDPSDYHGVCFTLGSPFADLPTDLIGLCVPPE